VVLDDGTIAKDYDGPLHGGHGGPRLATVRRSARLRARLPRWLMLIGRLCRR
jgi:hypothetical protein